MTIRKVTKLKKGIYKAETRDSGTQYFAQRSREKKTWKSKLVPTEREAMLLLDKKLLEWGEEPLYILKKKNDTY